MNWPEDPKTYVRIAEICEPLRHAFDQIVSLKRGANKTVIQWTGFKDIPSM